MEKKVIFVKFPIGKHGYPDISPEYAQRFINFLEEKLTDEYRVVGLAFGEIIGTSCGVDKNNFREIDKISYEELIKLFEEKREVINNGEFVKIT